MSGRRRGWLYVFLFAALLAVFLASCQAATPTSPPPAVTRPGLTIYPSWTPTPPPTRTPIPSATRTPIPSLTPVPTLSPTPRLIPVYEPHTALTVDLLLNPANNALHDLIVFTSSSLSPFNISTTENEALDSGPRLWAVAPDGLKSGRLTFDDVPFAAYFPADAGQKPVFVEYGVNFNHPDIQPLQLPHECYGWLPEDEADMLKGADAEACSDFRFSADGKYLAFFFGPTICSRGMMLLDTATGEVVYRSPVGKTGGFEFLDNGKLMYLNTHCEGGTVHLLDPVTRESRQLGTAGHILWNPQHTAMVVAVSPYHGASGAVWGYNVSSDSVFLVEPQTWQRDDHPIWAPDGIHVIFQRRPLSISLDELYSFTGPRQLISVDSHTGEQQVLAGEEDFDYHLCDSPTGVCDTWYGDWVQVRRFPFQSVTIPYTDDFYYDTRVTCLLYGRDCPFQVVLFALNWQTGKLLPWDESTLPASTPASPTPTPVPGPDLDSTPIYTHPEGLYAFYVGTDGRSLWLVAADGTSELWVREGQAFFYLP